jgi:predicted TIM-barrel fold metal-dependent hydrolase
LSEFLTGPILHFEPPLDALLRLITEPVEAGIRMYAMSVAEEYAALCELVALQRTRAAGKAFSIEEAVRAEIEADDLSFQEFMASVANADPRFLELYRSLERRDLRGLGVPQSEWPKEEAPLTPEEIGRALRDERPYLPSDQRGTMDMKAARLWPFLRRFWARRYHNAHRLLELYGGNADAPGIEVFFAAAVDFDVPLQAHPLSSPLEDQLQLMAAIAVVTDGRVLPFAPFDPRRDVEHDSEAFRLVKKGVTQYGCVGVKLYPPMGFRAFGNTGPDPGCSWPNDDYGKKLDCSLGRLFTWCRDNEVPILAHSSESNGVSKACQRLGGPDDWRTALENHPGLQVCVGHFGGDNHNAEHAGYARTLGFANLMHEASATGLYADVSYMPGLFAPESELSRIVDELLSAPASTGVNTQVGDRLLYGSDWFMISLDANEKAYALEMAKRFRTIGGEAQVAKVFSLNTIAFFRLAKQAGGEIGPLRGRLDTFFAQHQISPDWLAQIDSLVGL